MSRAPHLAAQAALVRMIYDPTFARAVKAAPRTVLAPLPHALADELGAIDLRALLRDRHRRERTLGQLCAELPGAAMLAAAEQGGRALLLAFYESAAFHEAIEGDAPLVLALANYLEGRLAAGALRGAHLPSTLALELASARARRDTGSPGPAGTLRRAEGVVPVEVPDGALATMRVLEAHRTAQPPTEWGVPGVQPALDLPALGAARASIVAVALGGEVSLVEVERPLYAVLVSLSMPRSERAVLEEAALRLGGDAGAAAAALASLVEDALVLRA